MYIYIYPDQTSDIRIVLVLRYASHFLNGPLFLYSLKFKEYVNINVLIVYGKYFIVLKDVKIALKICQNCSIKSCSIESYSIK